MSFFRNLFQWRTATPKPAEPTPVLAPAAAAPQVPAAKPVAALPPPVTPVPADAQSIPFPLKAITDAFPAELKPAIRKQPSEHVEIQIPRSLIEPQLATGAVRLTFEQLRGITPEIFFHPEAAGAETKVALPLDLVIRKLKPARRGDQRQPSIPNNIPSVFAKTGVTMSSAGSPVAEGWYTPRRPTYEPKPEPIAAPEPVADAVPAPPPVIPESLKPAPAPVAAEVAPIPPAPVVETPVAVMPVLLPVIEAPAPIAEPLPAAVPAIAEPEIDPNSFSIPFQTVAAALPDDIQAAFSGIASQTFVIPVSEIEPRMRTGKLRFKWSELRGWCVPPSTSEDSADVEIDLPMATVVPLFMARRNNAASRKRVEIDSRIPDVFGKANAAPVPEPDPEPVASTPPIAPPPPVTEPAPSAAAPEPARTWESRPLRIEQITVPPEPAELPVEQASPAIPEPALPEPAPPEPVAPPAPVIAAPAASTGPADAVRKIREIDNVTGAFVATADGLLVAADLADGNASILAAFAPTVFSQLAKYTDMAKLGKPEAIELHLGLTTIHVRKTGKLYLGILMPPGHSFPLEAVAPISSSLQPHSN